MFERSEEGRRVLVLDKDDARRAATCTLLERGSFPTIGASHIRVLEPYLADPLPTVLLFDVSVPRSWREVLDDHRALRAIVDDRCPIVLHGDRPTTDLTELEWATRATAHIPWHPQGRFLLPLLRRLLPPAAARPSRTTRPPSRSAIDTGPRPRLLLIDDSEITLELMQSQLSSRGFDIRIAVSLGEIRSIVSNWSPQVIVADVKRPDIPGDELCARLKSSVESASVLVLLCSSLPEAELTELARAAGADGHVSKSRGLDRFVSDLEGLVRRLLAEAPSSHRATEGP
jgi:CheY-like chemotaxis protein